MGAASRGPADLRVLVSEPLAETGVDLLRERFAVDLGVGWTREELEARIGDYDALVVRSATKVDAGLIERAERLRVIGRAGHRGGQRRRGRRHPARHRGLQRAGVQRDLGRRARHRPAPGAGAQHPPGPREPGGRPVGALALRRASR